MAVEAASSIALGDGGVGVGAGVGVEVTPHPVTEMLPKRKTNTTRTDTTHTRIMNLR